MIMGLRDERSPPDTPYPAAASAHRGDRRARHHRRDRQGRGRLQGRRGPRIRQPYYDLAKLFRKEALAPEGASWFFLAAPLIAVAAYLTIPLIAVGKLPGGGKGAGTRREPKGRSAVWTGLFPPDPPQARGTSDEGRRRRESGPEASGSTE